MKENSCYDSRKDLHTEASMMAQEIDYNKVDISNDIRANGGNMFKASKKGLQRLTYILLFMLLLPGTKSYALDQINIPQSSAENDTRFIYHEEVLRLALEASTNIYGPYQINRVAVSGTRQRLLRELIVGDKINVHGAPTQKAWEEQTIPVMFPLLKGLLGYRLMLIHRDNQALFSAVESGTDLAKLRAGLGAQWSTTKAMDTLGFRLVTGDTYEGLFNMLKHKRFDYFLRGVNEIFGEYKARPHLHDDIMIEDTLLVELPLPWYFFVSPTTPRIAERLDYGLHQMKKDGSFDRLFHSYFDESLVLAKWQKRKLIRIPNPLLPSHEIYLEPSYWLDLSVER